MKYTETNKQGQKVTRWTTDKKLTQQELEHQREEFAQEAQAGNVLCLSDLFINHGM